MTSNTNDSARLIAMAVEALENAAVWHEQQDKAISKQPNANAGQNGWMRLEHQEQMALLTATLAALRAQAPAEVGEK